MAKSGPIRQVLVVTRVGGVMDFDLKGLLGFLRQMGAVLMAPRGAVGEELERMGVLEDGPDGEGRWPELDAVLVVGGDGSMISASRAYAGRAPIFGINAGRLGFLTDMGRSNWSEKLRPMMMGRFDVEERCILRVSVLDPLDEVVPGASWLAMNDVHLGHGHHLSELSVRVGGEFLYRQYMNGLVVATPTGSTAYNLAAGGPILHPGLRAMTLVPICPQNLSNRPLVLGADAVIKVSSPSNKVVPWHLDGRPSGELMPCEPCEGGGRDGLVDWQTMEIRLEASPVRWLRPQGSSFFQVLRDKLGWCN